MDSCFFCWALSLHINLVIAHEFNYTHKWFTWKKSIEFVGSKAQWFCHWNKSALFGSLPKNSIFGFFFALFSVDFLSLCVLSSFFFFLPSLILFHSFFTSFSHNLVFTIIVLFGLRSTDLFLWKSHLLRFVLSHLSNGWSLKIATFNLSHTQSNIFHNGNEHFGMFWQIVFFYSSLWPKKLRNIQQSQYVQRK